MLRLSIIVPMYNVAPYVEKCIRSLENQDIPKSEYEIICVNDGSPDNCKEIVERLQMEFVNIKLIHQENQGVSRARNNAIDKAKGKYILFIDPDDYVDDYSFKRVVMNAEKCSAQIAFLGFTFQNEDGSVRNRVYHEKNSGWIYAGIEAYFIARGDGKTDPDRLWAVLLDRNFLDRNQLRFIPDIPYLEDGELMARLMCLAERCVFEGNSFYQRTTRIGSATNSGLFYSERAVRGFVRAAQNLRNFQQSEFLSSEQKVFLNQPIVKFTHLSLFPYCSINRLFDFLRAYNQLKQAGLSKLDLTSCNVYYRMEGELLKIWSLLFFIHRLLGVPLFRFVKYKI
ncbi:MAG: glycosyltransferase family 2 protein [Bacteroidales bacterium]